MSAKKEMFETEVKILDTMYLELVEALHNKPNDNDIEDMRLYLDNVFTLLNKSALATKEVKNMLIKNRKHTHETFNPPA